MTLDERITQGRERKARRYARALWDHWKPGERAAELAKLEREPLDFWRELAASIGAREPSAETIALILSKLREAVQGPA